MKRLLVVFAMCSAAPLVGGCGDDSGSGTPDMSTAGNPAPKLGAQIDRMGRPAINTALTDPFGLTPNTTTDDFKNSYNAETNPAMWQSKFKTSIEQNLAILDSADTVCGNSVGVMGDGTDGGNRYDFIAGVLADDELYVNSASGSCGLYLAVEASALGLGAAAADCGGRTPLEDTIDESYTLLTAGVNAYLGNMKAVTDGIDANDKAGVSATDFPFLTAPN
ncbi:MAG: hypothetical protein JWN44_4813 [Myxococcales bacterium]|nr:hypothetical protein [Myxococcales bacterium]